MSPPQQPAPGHHMITRSKTSIFKPKLYIANCLDKTTEPFTVLEAMLDPKWHKAMTEEYKALMDNQTWVLFKPSHPIKVIGSKWVFRIKYNSGGNVLKYKARLVAKGYHQTQGLDYIETFSPVVKSSTIRVILSLPVMNNWVLRQIDINNAFLNGYMNEEVYMEQPEGFVDSSKPNHVCRLHKSLYSLKQSPRAWFDKLRQVLTSKWIFTNSRLNTSLFLKRVEDQSLLVLVYIDDIILTCLSPQLVQEIITDMQLTFALKDLRELNYFLGTQVTRNTLGLHLSQSKYIVDLLGKVNLQDTTPCSTRMASGIPLTKVNNEHFLMLLCLEALLEPSNILP